MGTADKAPKIVSHSVEVAAGFRVTARLRVYHDAGGNLSFVITETRLRNAKSSSQSFRLMRTGTRACRLYVLRWKAKFQPFRYSDYYLVAIAALDSGRSYCNAVTEYWLTYD